MKSVNEQFAEMQKKTLASLEPMQNMNTMAAEAFERIARKNYDLMGDLVEYAVSQVKTPTNTTSLQDVYEQRVAETKAFAEKVNARAAEYVALAGELGDMAKSKATAAPDDKAAPIAETTEVAAAKVSSAAKTAKSASAKAEAETAKSASAKAEAETAKSASAEAETAKAAPAKAKPVAQTGKATPAKAKTATDTAKAAPAKATASSAKATVAESKAKPAATKKKVPTKKTAAKSK